MRLGDNDHPVRRQQIGFGLLVVALLLVHEAKLSDTEARRGLCSQLIEKVVVDDLSAQICYRFPVSTNFDQWGDRVRGEPRNI